MAPEEWDLICIFQKSEWSVTQSNPRWRGSQELKRLVGAVAHLGSQVEPQGEARVGRCHRSASFVSQLA